MTGTSVMLSRKPGEPSRPVSVALVNMPFAATERPSIQIALLKQIAEERGHHASTHHLNLDFASAVEGAIGPEAADLYESLAEGRFASGDWFFAEAAFGSDAPDPELAIADLESVEDLDARQQEAKEVAVRKIRDDVVPPYLKRMIDEIPWHEYDVVGFTCSFQQNVASFALARLLKERHPNLITVFGGANFDGDMGREWVRCIPWVDYAVQGEADNSFPDFLDAVANGDDPCHVAGVITAERGTVRAQRPAEPVVDLDSGPVPDYTEYFERLKRFGLMEPHDVMLPFESARGCWWGEKRHCTFCGLNGATMAFRSKSPRRVLNEIVELALRHGALRLNAVDNIIDPSYLDTLLPALAAKQRPVSLFYETKADLTKDQIELLAASGVDSVQPGIESLSTRTLGLMRKGTRSIWNVNFLRWSRYYGVHAYWNLLWGFPGETIGDVKEQIDVLPSLVHLQSPGSASRVWMERFSPLFVERDKFPALKMVPNSNYDLVYPSYVDLERAAYFFDYELDGSLDDEAYEPLGELVVAWASAEADDRSRVLLVSSDGDETLILDTRDPDEPVEWRLSGVDSAVHSAVMDRGYTPKAVGAALGVSLPRVEESLHKLAEHRILFRDGNMFLALALPASEAAVRGRYADNPWENMEEHSAPVQRMV